MRYFKVYNRNIKTDRAYYELNYGNFQSEVGNYASQQCPDLCNSDGELDEIACYEWMGEYAKMVYSGAEEEHGFDCGDFTLYIRDEDFSIFDLARR